jgi:hypothetical protein
MEQRELIRRWVGTWTKAEPELEAIRRKEIREADNLEVLKALESAFNHTVRATPLRPFSGLVEMQRWLAKLR